MRKFISICLSIFIILTVVPFNLFSFNVSAAENLIENGDFSNYDGKLPNNWLASINSQSGGTTSIVEDVELPNGREVNALKFTTTKSAGSNSFAYNGTVKIERNAKYTTTFWVKINNIKGFRTYMFEPNYIALNGSVKSSKYPQDGANIYTYLYDNGSTRVIRKEIVHTWKIAETGTIIDAAGPSMFITRSNNVAQVLTPDYPNTTRQGEWLQVIHTFETGNKAEHEAEVSYGFAIPAAVDGEVMIADLQMTVEKSPIDYYTPVINDNTLGTVSKKVACIDGKEVEITAEAFGENKFDGWFVDGAKVSSETKLTFVYDVANPPKYEAHFTKGKFGIDGSFENGYTKGTVLAQSIVVKDPSKADTDWTTSSYLASEKNNSGIYIDSHYGGTWRKATVTEVYSYSGKTALEFSGQYGTVGYKIPNLQKNTDYVVTFYAYSVGGGDGRAVGISQVGVTGANKTIIGKKTNVSYGFSTTDNPDVLYYDGVHKDTTVEWTKITLNFNSKNNEEVIVWAESVGLNAKLYLDDYAIARAPIAFKPAVNDINLGFVTPENGVICAVGQEVTVTASPVNASKFVGWYVGDEKVSDSDEFTFTYEEKYTALTAHFEAGVTTIPDYSFEKTYTNGQVLAESPNVAYGGVDNDGLWTEDLFKTSSKDGNNKFFIDSEWSKWGKAIATTEQAHTGSYSIKMTPNSRFMGYKLEGLNKNTNYTLNFYAFSKGTTVSTTSTLGSIIVTDANVSCITKNDDTNRLVERTADTGALARINAANIDCRESWKKCTVNFNSQDSQDVIVWVRNLVNGNLYLDDFSIFEPIKASYSAGLGGDVTSNITSEYVAKGSTVSFVAVPYEGNTFAGWYDAAGKCVSTEANYTFVANESFSLTAKFSGYNMPTLDLFSINGNDGTFENGSIDGWYGSDPAYESNWCSYNVATGVAYEGTKSLKVNARHRNSLLPLTGLSSNTNYRLTLYINLPDANFYAKIDSMAIIGENDNHLGSASTIFTDVKMVAANSGWNRVDMYFNTGENVKANFILRYTSENPNTGLYIDNMSLYQYEANDELLNGKFNNRKENWLGDGEAAKDGANNVLTLNAYQTTYQNLAVDTFSTYNVSFKAKGNLTAAAIDLGKLNVKVKNYLSSVSFTDANSTDWKEYSFKLYSGIHKAVSIAFKANADGAMIDDVKITKEVENAGSIYEQIDFETERFAYTEEGSQFSIYEASGANDPYVKSGNKSLKFTYNKDNNDEEIVFNPAWLSYQPGFYRNLKISFNYKFASEKGGKVFLAPEYSGTYGADTGFEQITNNSDWNRVTFYVTNTAYATFKLKIASIAYNTESDFYIDDIVISPSLTVIDGGKTINTYCESLYNVIGNEGFEYSAEEFANINVNSGLVGFEKNTKTSWVNLPDTTTRIKGDALKGSYFLRAEEGTHYVIPVQLKPALKYCFAASIRGTSGTVGRIGITDDPEGTKYYINRDEEEASMVEFNANKNGWQRSGFNFSAYGSAIVYLVIDVEKGALDIDSVMMFEREYGYSYDPNDYTEYVPYDYDDLQSNTTVINGGYGYQPYYVENATSNKEFDSSGDINDDGETTAFDMVLLARYIAGWNVDVVYDALDVNGDNRIDLSDVLHFAKYLAEWEDIKLCGGKDLNDKMYERLDNLLLGEDEELNQEAIYNEGNLNRLANAINKSKNGEEVTIIFYGNSANTSNNSDLITATYPYTEKIGEWWSENIGPCKVITAGAENLTSINACMRVDNDVLQFNPDVVFLDFAIQDAISALAKTNAVGYDNLIRRILQHETTPAVVSLMLTGAEQQSYTMNPANANVFASAAKQHKQVSEYYNLPIIDFEYAFWENSIEIVKITELKEIPLLTWNDIAYDNVIMNNDGHTILAGTIIYYLNQVLNKLDTVDNGDYKYSVEGYFGIDKYMNGSFISVGDIIEGDAIGYSFDLTEDEMADYEYNYKDENTMENSLYPCIETYRHYVSVNSDNESDKSYEVNPYYLSLNIPTVLSGEETYFMFNTSKSVSIVRITNSNSLQYAPISMVCYDEVGNVISTVKVSAGYYIECVDLGKTSAVRLPIGTSRIEFKIYTNQGTVRLLGMSYFDKAE